MKHFKSVLAMLLALVMVLSCVGTAFAADSKELSVKTPATDIAKDPVETAEKSLKGFKSESFKLNNAYQYADDEIVRVIVILEGEAEAEVGETGSEKAASQRVKLVNQHNGVFKKMAAIDYELKYEFTRLINGFSCEVAYGDLEAIAAIEGVDAVYIANSYEAPVFETAADTKQNIANQIVGNDLMHAELWDGYGTVVAVLDTGLNLEHEAFQDNAGWAEDYAVLDQAAVEAADLWVDGVYVSGKIPFAYDYADRDQDVTDKNGHGTHVSGSAVGMACTVDEYGSANVTFAGAAPAAQLLSMKIFSDAGGGTYSDIYFYAMEDAYTLGADVINMSIGAQNGFTYDDGLETEVFGNIYQNLSDAGVILSIAAGNEYSMAEFASNYDGYMAVTGPEYTDYGTIASPASYESNVSVASLENAAYPDWAIQIDGEENIAAYADSCEDGEHGWVQNFGGKNVDYQIVLDAKGNISLGTEEDFAAYEEGTLEGKIAIVSRGELDFETKVENAAKAGAIGCIVVNNDTGIILMSIETFEIPAISLQKSALSLLSVTGSIYTPETMSQVPNPNAYLMSDFSNWGTTPMLTLDPSITAIGGMVYSSVPGGTDTYEIYSGTSMAAPNMSGMYANLLSAIREYNEDAGIEMTKAEVAELAKDLIHSTAILLTDADGYHYSPRKQGAGLGCSWNAAWSYSESAYITNPLQELGDDAEKTGVYTMSIELKNDATFDLYYTDFETYVLYDYLTQIPDGPVVNTLTSDYAFYGNEELSTEEEVNYADVSYTIDGVEVTEFNLAAGESVTVDVTITLADGLKNFYDNFFPNGTFVEGYVVFNEYYEGQQYSSAHATFMAYYGDWTQAPVLEESDFMDIVDAEYFLNSTVADADGNTYGDLGLTWDMTTLLSYYTNPNSAYITDAAATNAVAFPGDNMLDYVPYNPDRIAFSTPLTDGTYNYAEAIYMEPYMLRNARHLIMTVTDKETGEVYYVDDTEYLPKAVFDADYGMWFATASYAWDGTDMEGNYVPSGTVATITYDAVLPYGDAEQNAIWGFDVTVDYTAPVLEEIVFDEEAMTLTVTASDENYLQGIYIADLWYEILDAAVVTEDVKGGSFTATFDVSELAETNAKVIVTAIDYATNEMEKEITIMPGAGEAATINLVTPFGTTTVETVTGESFIFPYAEEPENYAFMFWAPERVEAASEDEVWDVPEPWWFDGDTMIVTETEYTFYALYAVLDTVELDKTNYYMDYDVDYTGDWAICGWDVDADSHWITENPKALDAEGNTIRVADLEDAEVGDYYIEFSTNEKGIRYTFENLGDDIYTIQNAATGKYLATNDSYEITFVDEVTDEALWYVVSGDTGYSTLIFNIGVDEAVLVYNDETHAFAVMDDSEPYIGDDYASQWFCIELYRATEYEEVVLYYTTEADVELPCYFNDFVDCEAEWYHEAVDFMVANGLMNGMGGNKFGPNTALSRAMVVTVLYRLMGSPEVAEPSTFTDVPTGIWYSDAIAWAQDEGIVNGVTATTFAPDQNVTREQIATILWRFVGCPEVEADLSSFGDAASVSPYAADAINWAVAEGIMNGDGKNLNPLNSATRAEFACMFTRMLGGSYECNEE